eukprot:5768209-Amphidinium_carterae.1
MMSECSLTTFWGLLSFQVPLLQSMEKYERAQLADASTTACMISRATPTMRTFQLSMHYRPFSSSFP